MASWLPSPALCLSAGSASRRVTGNISSIGFTPMGGLSASTSLLCLRSHLSIGCVCSQRLSCWQPVVVSRCEENTHTSGGASQPGVSLPTRALHPRMSAACAGDLDTAEFGGCILLLLAIAVFPGWKFQSWWIALVCRIMTLCPQCPQVAAGRLF